MKNRHRKHRLKTRNSVLHQLLAKAQQVIGTREDAIEWFSQPAIGLNSRRPVELAVTADGASTVRTRLERMEHGVYV